MAPGEKTETSPASPIGTVVDRNSSLSVSAVERNERTAGIGSSVPATAVDAGSEKTIPVPTSNLNSSPDDNDADSIESKDELTLSKGRCIALVATVTGASFLNTLAGQSVVIILPHISRDLGIPDTRQQWIVSSYILAFGCFLLLWGRVADIYGKRLIFILGSIWVTICCVVNPFLPSEIPFDLFRGLHGLGAAANVPTAIGILGTTFPPGRAKNYAFSAYAAGSPLGSVCGNLVSGLIAEWASWKWIFGALAIMAGIISVAGIMFIPIPPMPPAAHGSLRSKTAAVDWIGATMITVGLLALMFALTEGNVVGWTTPWVPVLIVVSILIIVAFGFWQHYLETKTTRPPLVKMSVFHNWRFSAVMVIMGLFFGSFNNFLIYATYYFQDYQGLSPLQTMLRFIPTGIGGFIIAFIVANLLDRIPTFFILAIGHTCVCIATLLYAVPIPPTTSYFAWGLPAMILSVIGADTAWPCLTLFTSRALPQEDQAVGGALINATGMFGRAIALAIATAVQSSTMASAREVDIQNVGPVEAWDGPSLKGLRAASWANFVIAVLALALVVVTFRSMEIIGKKPDRPDRPDGMMNSDAGDDLERR
ncbi:major facilitator superfamily domain-containing protein [Ilyonectria destructans]|nr:major facilitator superfamily domain-containing protein [Ilyonectria destructans]